MCKTQVVLCVNRHSGRVQPCRTEVFALELQTPCALSFPALVTSSGGVWSITIIGSDLVTGEQFSTALMYGKIKDV